MELKDWLSLVSLLLAIFAFFYSLFSNTKKYELTNSYRNQILSWYSLTNEVLIKLKIEVENNINNKDKYFDLLACLSGQIEVGRFYFPNFDKNDDFGKEKPLAYRGYRNIILEFLVYSYDIYNKKEPFKYLKHAEVFQRYFTSFIFEIIDPKKHLMETQKYTNRTFTKEFCIEDFLEKEPNTLSNFLAVG